MTKIVVFPGTFDPITYGHQDLLARAAKIFSRVIVAIAESKNKHPVFSLQQRIAMAEQALSAVTNIEIKGFNNLLVDFARTHGATAIIRGLRVATDFEYELQLANINRHLASDIETVFLTPSEQHSYISSSLVKEAAQLGGDVSAFVNPDVAAELRRIVWP